MKPLFLFTALLFLIFSCSKNSETTDSAVEYGLIEAGGDENSSEPEQTLPNIFDFVSNADNLTMVSEALKIVDNRIKTDLSNEGQMTFFVPTDEAFNTFFDTLENYGSISDFGETTANEILTRILEYHIVNESALFSDALSHDKVVLTQLSETLQVVVDGDIFLRDTTDVEAKITDADNEVSNGVVHIIDKVLLPEAIIDALYPKSSLIQTIQDNEELSLLAEALTKANLMTYLEGEGPFTIFAPTNAAIETLFVLLGDDYNSFDDFNNILEQQALKEILLGHIIEGKLASKDFRAGTLPTLLPNDSIEFIEEESTFVIKDASQTRANFVSLDLEASNGTIHSIDKILIPQKALSLVQ